MSRLARRDFVVLGTMGLWQAARGGQAIAGGRVSPAGAQAARQSAPAPGFEEAVADLVTANQVLAHEAVLDGFGHVSARDPRDPQRYLLARSVAPELVTRDDIIQYDLDSRPMDARRMSSSTRRIWTGCSWTRMSSLRRISR